MYTAEKERLCAIAAEALECDANELSFEDGRVVREATGEEMSLVDVATKSQVSNCLAPETTAMHSSLSRRRRSW